MKNIPIKINALVLFLMIFLHLSAQDKNDEIFFPSASPEQVGIDSRYLAQMLEKIQTDSIRIHSIVILRHDSLVLESYVYPYNRETTQNVKSVCKSIISALAGIAKDQGYLKDVNVPIYQIAPQYFENPSDYRKLHISLKNLLTMTTGLDVDENGGKLEAIFSADDYVQAAFDAPMVADPGTKWTYSTCLSHAMSAILSQITHQDLLKFAKNTLFGPLGMKSIEWDTDPNGYYMGGAELWMRPIDMAKFGYLYLKDGEWQGQQLISREWILESTANQIGPLKTGNDKYGYYWRVCGGGWLMAIGWGGQMILFNRDLDMVVVFTASEMDKQYQLFDQYILPAIHSATMSPNPETNKTLQQWVDRLQQSEKGIAHPVPQWFSTYVTNVYAMDPNIYDYEQIQFLHDDSDLKVRVKEQGKTNEYVIGLDGSGQITTQDDDRSVPRHKSVWVRGHFPEDSKLSLEIHELGSVFHLRHQIDFSKPESLEILSDLYPLMNNIKMAGKNI